MENTEQKQERIKSILVYAGREGKDSFRYFELRDNHVYNFGLYKKLLFKTKIIGACFDIEKEGESAFYNKNTKPQYLDFYDKENIISQWKIKDSLIIKNLKEKLDTQTINKFEPLKNFRSYFRTLDSVEKQVVLIDLIKYLNQ